jgi:hypothetical protein
MFATQKTNCLQRGIHERFIAAEIRLVVNCSIYMITHALMSHSIQGRELLERRALKSWALLGFESLQGKNMKFRPEGQFLVVRGKCSTIRSVQSACDWFGAPRRCSRPEIFLQECLKRWKVFQWAIILRHLEGTLSVKSIYE